MYDKISQLFLYTNSKKYEMLFEIADVIEKIKTMEVGEDYEKEAIIRINKNLKKILELCVENGISKNIWHGYLTYLLAFDENVFTKLFERNTHFDDIFSLAKNDYKIFRELFFYDFSYIEDFLDVDIFSKLSNFADASYKTNEILNTFREKLANTRSEDDFFDVIENFYRKYGVGNLAFYKTFRLGDDEDLIPIRNTDNILLEDIIGYGEQKEKVRLNTKIFVENGLSNNVLLYGDSGTGKSSTIKAIANEFFDAGLRVIEVYKHQFSRLASLINEIKDRRYFFILFMDDLSFEESELEYKYLKSIIEGSSSLKPNNILIYATSNRRHLVKETWEDRQDGKMTSGVYKNDTVEEKLSLSKRFGLSVYYGKPSKMEYLEIVKALANRNNLNITKEELEKEANKWEIARGGYSGRLALQLVNHLKMREKQ